MSEEHSSLGQVHRDTAKQEARKQEQDVLPCSTAPRLSELSTPRDGGASHCITCPTVTASGGTTHAAGQTGRNTASG